MSAGKQKACPGEDCAGLATEADLPDGRGELKAATTALRDDIRLLERSLKVWLITAAVIQGFLNALIRHLIWSGA